MKYQGSRILNEQASFLGLSVIDLGVLGYALILSHQALETLKIGILSFVIVLILAIALIQIRLTQRKKIIRDHLRWFLRGRVLFFYRGVR